MTYSAIRVEGDLITKESEGFQSLSEAEAHATLFHGSAGRAVVTPAEDIMRYRWTGSALELRAEPTDAEKAALVILTSTQFWLSVSAALSLDETDGDPKAYVASVAVASTRLTGGAGGAKGQVLAYLNSANFARADGAKALLEAVAMDLELGNPDPGDDEPTRLAKAQGALDLLFLIGETI